MPEGDIRALAKQTMALARNHIVLHLRFMDMAVFRLRLTPADTTLATEGAHLFYGEKHVLRRYLRAEQRGLSRDYLHVLLHCVFRHPFIDTLVEAARWDLACDIAVEGVILAMEDEHFALPVDAARASVVERLRQAVRPMTAEKLYRWFADHPPEPGWYDLFHVDEHTLWHKPRQAREMERSGRDEGGEGGEGGERAPNDAEKQHQPETEDAQPSPAAPGEDEPGADEGEGASAQAGEASPEAPDDSEPAGMSARGDPAESEDKRQSAMRASESDGQTGNSVGKYDEKHRSEQQNVGRDMDTEGREGVPAGSQSRNDRTDGGLDSPHSMGIGGDSGDAASQSSASSSGGSGSGLNDAFVTPEEGAEVPEPSLMEDARDDSRDALEQEWREVGERIQTDLDTFSRQQGGSAGDMREQLEALNRERIDYAAFLRRFAVLGEAAELSDDEFDQIFYTYGLRIYKNLPLIEPLETREVMRVRDFVIAIDTSGSTSGALVKRFIEKTWAILHGEENFFKKINLYIVQCDAQVREAARVTSEEEFDAYMETFAVKGLGGTDFRPVFQYVDDLLAQGAFTRLKGLIYFTDGIGTYPARKPDYETAFVFLRQDAARPQVPAWAIRVLLEEEDIEPQRP